MRREDILAEDAIKCSIDPVRQGWLFKIAYSVDLEGDPIATFGHVLYRLGVAGISVVEQRRRKERSKLNGREDCDEQCP